MSSLERAAMYFALFRSAHWPYFGYPRGFVVGKKVGRPFQAVENDVNANDGLERPSYEKDTR
ncbi:MAG: hypothetical protein K9M08_06430 [Pirellula sp.]|jgi:hypothetical protein|nr:hypothetical protein [Pirellula sp.]